ncbi:hypothetical protein [Asticcacaulis excentricus]|uniref:hypothetical protein n=1 Tax=Asticcacaulis excentricus TaxID=78587 RepID=UPI000F84892A|nr:hypothetical protein [Asticcacaulis excentricus]
MRDIEGIEQVLEALKPHWAEIEQDFDTANARFLELAAGDHEPVGKVLKAHLLVEHHLNEFLPSFFGFGEFHELRLSFAQKARMLPTVGSSAAFVRPGILQLNKIRNKFGHQLNYQIEFPEIQAILDILSIAREGHQFDTPIDAIEAFTPVACAFLQVPPKHLQDAFVNAFKNIRAAHQADFD